jgi:hypothetical protein
MAVKYQSPIPLLSSPLKGEGSNTQARPIKLARMRVRGTVGSGVSNFVFTPRPSLPPSLEEFAGLAAMISSMLIASAGLPGALAFARER